MCCFRKPAFYYRGAVFEADYLCGIIRQVKDYKEA
jgi:hypothetical protein